MSPPAEHAANTPAPRILGFRDQPSLSALVPKILFGRSRPPREGEAPPPIRVVIEDHGIDTPRLATYRRLCGFDPPVGGEKDRLRVPLPHFFVTGFRAQVALLADRAFPASPLGMVHLRNRFEMSSQVHGGDRLRIESRLGGWRQVRTGWEVDTETTFHASGDSSEGKIVARSVSTSLARGGGLGEASEGKPGEARRTAPEGGDWQELESWQLAADTGRRYAKTSGDYNPIHLWPLTARLLGYRRPIAHGLYLVSRATAALENLHGSPLRTMEVRFKTPTFLPAECRLYRRPKNDEGSPSFELWSADGQRPHLFGSYEPTTA